MQGEHLVEHPLRRVEPVGRVVRVEQDADLLRERPAQPVEEVAVGHVLLAGVEQPLVLRVVGEVEHQPVRVDPPADCLPELLAADVNLPGLHHLVGAEPVQVREGDLPDQLIQGLLRLEARALMCSKWSRMSLRATRSSSVEVRMRASSSACTSSFLTA